MAASIYEIYREAESNAAPTEITVAACTADENAIESRGRAAFESKSDEFLNAWIGSVIDILSCSDCNPVVVEWFADRGIYA